MAGPAETDTAAVVVEQVVEPVQEMDAGVNESRTAAATEVSRSGARGLRRSPTANV
jgi:hypothetical protein